MKDTIIIGIAGGTGCGKSTLINRIKDEFNDEITILSHDFYYKQHNDIPFEERKKINYDHPSAFDTDIMISHIKELAAGHTIERPVYDFTIHNRIDETVTVYPAKVIVVEGILIFENEELRDLCDIKVFIDTDADVRIIRRILRDVKERGRMLDNIVEQYLTTVKPMHYIYVEPTKYMADIVLNSGLNDVVFDVIKVKIQHHLDAQKGI